MALLRKLSEIVGFYSRSLYTQVESKDVFLWAQAIAFKSLVAVIPILIIGVGLFGPTLARIVHELLPAGQGNELIAFAERLQRASGTITVVGIVGLTFTGVTLFSTLRGVLANVFVEEWHEQRSILGGYIFDLRMAAQVGALFVLTLAISTVVQAMNLSGPQIVESLGFGRLWLEAGWMRVLNGLGVMLPIVIATVMFFQLYYLIPLPHPPKRSVVAGAAFAAVLFELAKFAFALYARRLGAFDRYTQAGDSGLGGVSDAFGVIIAFVFWAYYSGLVLILGAIVVLLHESRVREKRTSEDPPTDVTGS